MTVATFAKDYWQATDSEVEFIESSQPPENTPVTAVKLFHFNGQRILMVNTPKGWDVPGGHIEPGETPDVALRREILEETRGTLGDYALVGYLKVTKVTSLHPNELNGSYPRVSSILLYKGEISNIAKNSGSLRHEATAVKFLGIQSLGDLARRWSRLNQQITEHIASIS